MRLILITPLLLVLVPQACATEMGRMLLEQECSGCHAVGLTGKSPNPKAPPFREVAKRYPPDNLTEALAEGIVTGHNEMPEFIFEPTDIQDIVSYLETLRNAK